MPPITLLTGMSATGKSRAVAELAALGHRAVDLDTAEWSRLVPDHSEYADPAADEPLDWHWREDAVRDLLTAARGTLFVAGTSTYQSRLYPLLDHIVLLTVPEDVALRRLATRTSNTYGKATAERRRELDLRATVEPALRATSCLEIDTSAHPPATVAATVAEHAARTCGRRVR